MSENTEIIAPIHTSCKNCVYAIYNDNTQSSCYLGLIDKFRVNNTNILEAYDEEKEFYVINDKKCMGYVTNDFFMKRSIESIEDKINYFNSHNYIHYTLWINLKAFDTEVSFKRLSDCLSSVKIKPSNIIIIREKDKFVDLHTYENIQKVLIDANFDNIIWRIQTMLDSDFTEEYHIHDVVSSSKNRFVCLIHSVPHHIDNIINKANNIVHQHMDSFSILSNNDKSCRIFPVSIYKYYLYSLKKELLKEDSLYTIV